jgi:hypothetical protein
MLRPTAPTARPRLSPWGKRAAGGSLTTVGLRPPLVSLPTAPFSSRLSVCCRDLPKGGSNDLAVVSQSCVKDEGGPLGIGFQEQVSNQSELLR